MGGTPIEGCLWGDGYSYIGGCLWGGGAALYVGPYGVGGTHMEVPVGRGVLL